MVEFKLVLLLHDHTPLSPGPFAIYLSLWHLQSFHGLCWIFTLVRDTSHTCQLIQIACKLYSFPPMQLSYGCIPEIIWILTPHFQTSQIFYGLSRLFQRVLQLGHRRGWHVHVLWFTAWLRNHRSHFFLQTLRRVVQSTSLPSVWFLYFLCLWVCEKCFYFIFSHRFQ